ncbi:hypothetical protein [Nocardia inohanensis]|uniref:hypothetical protein n=1 Tax=Nocardia inohanensis TaxID=209246 RepID=UPI00082BFD9D|nr:hypothetical protein [Nocardia inohanensis]
MTKSLFTLGASILGALAASALAAAPASASIESIAVTGTSPGSWCKTDSGGCSIVVELSGSSKYSDAEFLVDGVSLGTAPAVTDLLGKTTATKAWNPTESKMYTVQVKQSGSISTITYLVGKGNGSTGGCWWMPSGSSMPGSAGTGSAGSGSGGSGSAGSGSSSGSVNTGSSSGSAC